MRLRLRNKYFRYLSENELLEGGQIQLPPTATPVVVTSVASGGVGQPGQRSYYVWKEPPSALPPAYDQYGNQVMLVYQNIIYFEINFFLLCFRFKFQYRCLRLTHPLHPVTPHTHLKLDTTYSNRLLSNNSNSNNISRSKSNNRSQSAHR